MDEPTQQPDLSQMQQRHEAEDQDIDPVDVALLFNRVGSELTKIDKQSVSPSTKSAMQLDQKSVFSGMNPNTSKPASPPPVANNPVVPPAPVRTVDPAPRRPVVDVDQNIEKRILEMEKSMKKIISFSSAYQKAKKIKRGLKYSVSSNSMKGEIKDADVLLEYVLCEISKGVKTITIKICED